MLLVSSCNGLCPIHWSQVLSREWGYSWSRRSTTSEWSTSLLPANVSLILEILWYIMVHHYHIKPSAYGISYGAMTWWRHQMKHFRVTSHFAGNSLFPVNSPHKGQWRGALVFSLICTWINGWVNNREAGDLRRHRGHYDVNEMEHAKYVIYSNFPISIMRGNDNLLRTSWIMGSRWNWMYMYQWLI